MKIEVTQSDIYEAQRLIAGEEPSRADMCPLAIAISRAAGRPWCVGISYACAVKDRDQTETRLPDVAIDFRRAFDMDKPVSPFTFDLPVQP